MWARPAPRAPLAVFYGRKHADDPPDGSVVAGAGPDARTRGRGAESRAQRGWRFATGRRAWGGALRRMRRQRGRRVEQTKPHHRPRTFLGLLRHPRQSVDGIIRSNTGGIPRDKARNNTFRQTLRGRAHPTRRRTLQTAHPQTPRSSLTTHRTAQSKEPRHRTALRYRTRHRPHRRARHRGSLLPPPASRLDDDPSRGVLPAKQSNRLG